MEVPILAESGNLGERTLRENCRLWQDQEILGNEQKEKLCMFQLGSELQGPRILYDCLAYSVSSFGFNGTERVASIHVLS